LWWVILAGAAVQMWPWILGGLAVGVACRLLWWWLLAEADRIADERAAETARQATLILHADTEHELYQQSSLDGIYGSYAPAEELRGVGIWLPDTDLRRSAV
jgi:hypothetical protein